MLHVPGIDGEGEMPSPVGCATFVSPLEKPCRYGWAIYIISKMHLHGAIMPINVNNPEADAPTRKFAHMAGVSITYGTKRV